MTKKSKYALLIAFSVLTGIVFDQFSTAPEISSNKELAAFVYLMSFILLFFSLSSALFALGFRKQLCSFINPIPSEDRKSARIPYAIAAATLVLYFSGNIETIILSTTVFCIGEILCIENQLNP